MAPPRSKSPTRRDGGERQPPRGKAAAATKRDTTLPFKPLLPTVQIWWWDRHSSDPANKGLQLSLVCIALATPCITQSVTIIAVTTIWAIYCAWFLSSIPTAIFKALVNVFMSCTFAIIAQVVGKPFPSSPQDITLDFIHRRLGITNATRVEVKPIGGGFIGETVRVVVSIPNQDTITFIAKMSPSSLSRRAKMRAMASVYARESWFYATIGQTLQQQSCELRIPTCLGVFYDPFGGTSLLLMEDVKNFSPGNEENGAGWSHACSVVRRYASFHALFYCDSLAELNRKHKVQHLRVLDWMDAPPQFSHQLIQPAFEEILHDHSLVVKYANEIIATVIKPMFDNLPAIIDYFKHGRAMTVIHGDCRVENMMFPKTGNGTTTAPSHRTFDLSYDAITPWFALDWQTITKGPGIYDVAYFVSLCLNVGDNDDDATIDCTLVERYVDTLQSFGVTTITFDSCYLDYRISCCLAALIPLVIMSPKSIGEETKDRGGKVRRAMLSRSFATLKRINAAGALHEILCNKKQSLPNRMLSFTIDVDHKYTPMPRRALTGKDDSFSHHSEMSIALHQAAEERGVDGNTTNVPGKGVKDAYDRWYVNGCSPCKTWFFGFACGFYPHRQVMDASFSVVLNGVQTSIRGSRQARPTDFEAISTVIGTGHNRLVIQVTKALQSGRLVVGIPDHDDDDDNTTIVCDLHFESRFDAQMEPPFQLKLSPEKAGIMNYERLTQLVQWSGWIKVHGVRVEIDTPWLGVRDRSWGFRPHGTADRSPFGNRLVGGIINSHVGTRLLKTLIPIKSLPQFYWLWCPLHLETFGVLLHSQQLSDGTPQNEAVSMLMHVRGGTSTPATGKVKLKRASVTIQYHHESRHARQLQVRLDFSEPIRSQGIERYGVIVECTPAYPFFMTGVGYNDVKWGHGVKQHGKDGMDVFSTDEMIMHKVDRNLQQGWHIQEVSTAIATWIGSHGTRVGRQEIGIGCLEQMVLGPHEPSGFVGLCGVE